MRHPDTTLRSDLGLAERAAAGDSEAFEALVRRYQTSLVRFCVGLLGDDHGAHDAAQDTFFAAWRTVGDFRGDAQFSTWLYRIATNRCLKEIARRRPRTTEIGELASTVGLPGDELEASESAAAAVAAIKLLTHDQRVALVLRDIEDLTYQEISDVLGIGLSAVKSRIHRARIDLVRQRNKTATPSG